ncbi:PEP-CTERM sorting domain-containing protein [Massilia rhizosphaerae]|uniref:PEP-CTERM sorting domain-containing protein n=1 Tax=Massilia rhizosphaerae TaxID=2784389 RepID=UPI0018DE64E4|nr:PEP-CTERM sorting domain-containing protein [Massilia rhizosphaerae]
MRKFAFATLAFAVAGVANATVMTLSMSGYINNGYDSLGLFGGNGALGGKYTLTVSVDLDRPIHYSSSPGSYAGEDSTGPFNVAATVNGITYTFAVANNVSMYEGVSTSGVLLYGTGTDELGRLVTLHESVMQRMAVTSLTDYMYLSSPPTPIPDPIVSLRIGSGNAVTLFNSYIARTVILNGDPVTLPQSAAPAPGPTASPASTSVPEPASALLFGAGLLGLAGLRRRKNRC